MNEKFFIIDGHALAYRAYYTFVNNVKTTTYGFDTGTIYGFIKIIFYILKIEKPKYIAVVFDTKAPTWRKQVFDSYKANRPKQPQSITESLPYIKQILNALNIVFLEQDSFEADDIIGTLTTKIHPDINVYIMTPDKDYEQLISNNIFLYKPIKHSTNYEIIDVQKVQNKWHIQDPKNVIDILALAGDKSDNIPGIQNIGLKTAAKIIAQYGSIDNIYDNIQTLSDDMREKFLSQKEQILLYKNIATICLNVPLEIKSADFIRKDFNKQELQKIFTQLEFASLLKELNTIQENKQAGLFDM